MVEAFNWCSLSEVELAHSAILGGTRYDRICHATRGQDHKDVHGMKPSNRARSVLARGNREGALATTRADGANLREFLEEDDEQRQNHAVVVNQIVQRLECVVVIKGTRPVDEEHGFTPLEHSSAYLIHFKFFSTMRSDNRYRQ